MAYDLGTAHGTIEIEYDGAREVDRAAKDLKKLSAGSKDTNKSMKRLGATLKTLGKGAAITGMSVSMAAAAASAANLAVQVLGVVPALASITSLSAALPGLFVAGAAAGGVLKASLLNVGDATKAAFDTEHPEKLEEALKKLSPAAREFAKTLQANVPALKNMQKGLQETFFKSAGLTTALKGGISAMKEMKPELTSLTTTMGGVVKGFTSFALQARSIDFVKNAVKSFEEGLKSASRAQTPLLTGLRAVGEVGTPLLRQLGAAVGDVGTKFGNWLSQVAADGRLQQWIDTALATLQQLGDIAKNVGGILNSIMGAAASTGGGLLGTIKEITGQFNAFLKSAEGKAAITSLFKGLADVARGLAPIITTVAGSLAGALGPALSKIAGTLGPALLKVVQALAPALGPLATALADVVVALAPLLPPIAKLLGLLVTLGAGVLSTLAKNLTPVIELFAGAFTGALEQFAPVVDQVVALLPQLATTGIQLATALAPLMPAVIELASAFATALLPVLPQLMEAGMALVPPLVELAQAFADLAPSLVSLIPLIPPLLSLMVQMQKNALFIVTAVIKLITWIIKAGQAIFEFGKKIGEVLVQAATNVGLGIARIIAFFKGLPPKARAALSALGSIITGIARSAWNAFNGAVTAGITKAVGLARSLPGRLRSAISAMTSLIGAVARAAWNSFMSATRAGINTAVSTARGLPGRIRGAVGNLGRLLVSAGRDVVMGLVNGMKGAIGAAISAAANLGRGILNGVKGALGISSPSKEMIKVGRFVNEGLIKGLTGTAKQVQAAATRVANMVVEAYSDRLISKKRKNSILKTISRNNKQLVALANRAATVAERLKKAQASLAAVQKSYNETFASARDAVRGSFSLIGSGEAANDVEDAKARFKIALDQARAFAKNIATLVKRGLSKDLIAQLVAAGPEAGGQMAAALATANNATIKEFNDLQTNMNNAAARVGKSAADALYGAGLAAAKGLVKGLESQQKAIENLMLRIAKSMEKAIKKALHIKSPSRIMFKLGQFISEGLALGIDHMRSQVDKAAQKLAAATILPTVRLTTSPSGAGVSSLPTPAPQPSQPSDTPGGDFGPYYLVLDGKVVSGFVVNTITGNPKVVAKAAKEGEQKNAWSGSGRGNR